MTSHTVDGYLTEARRLFDAHDRTELVISAVLAGEIGLDELRRQPPGIRSVYLARRTAAFLVRTTRVGAPP